jgi:phi13 family phage major tail protein
VARKGLEYCVYAPLTEDEAAGTFSYGVGKKGRKLINADVKINNADAELYGDNGIGENSSEFVDGDVTIGKDELTDTLREDWLGNTTKSITVGEETVDELIAKDNDKAPYQGLGYIETLQVDNADQYRAVFYTKVKFKEPDDSAESKGKTVAFKTPVIVGKLYRRVDHNWRESITTTSFTTALAYIKGKVGLT